MTIFIDPESELLTLRFSQPNRDVGIDVSEIWIELSESKGNQTVISAMNVQRLEDLRLLPEIIRSLKANGFDSTPVTSDDWELIRQRCQTIAAFDPNWPES